MLMASLLTIQINDILHLVTIVLTYHLFILMPKFINHIVSHLKFALKALSLPSTNKAYSSDNTSLQVVCGSKSSLLFPGLGSGFWLYKTLTHPCIGQVKGPGSRTLNLVHKVLSQDPQMFPGQGDASSCH